MKVFVFVLRLVFLLSVLLISLELTWRLMTPEQRNYLLHQIPAFVMDKIPLDPAQPSLLQRFGPVLSGH